LFGRLQAGLLSLVHNVEFVIANNW